MQHHVRRQLGLGAKNSSRSARKLRINEQRLARRAAGLCVFCNEPALPDRSECQRHKESRDRRRHSKQQTGKCNYCGKPPPPGRALCLMCLAKVKEHMSRLKAERLEANLCERCGKRPPSEGLKQCRPCADRAKNATTARRKERLVNGMCGACGLHPILTTQTVCKACYYKRISCSSFGTCADGKALEEMFEKQEGKCPLSGRQIVLGDTAELDHILAISRGGLVNDLQNVRWVHKMVNRSKQHYTDEEFLELVRDIARHSGLT